ncbi:hypothetical protein GWK47_035286 [Chionoecetes opilio]|uniref:Uncharacterized protein n=1 Tax=Chionoecetes opilio TaxID=41210 RepID=A0A8J5D395_CHIOP|nr:hypothetical protein GWK47_035286 [Chionoecetes opilio]
MACERQTTDVVWLLEKSPTSSFPGETSSVEGKGFLQKPGTRLQSSDQQNVHAAPTQGGNKSPGGNPCWNDNLSSVLHSSYAALKYLGHNIKHITVSRSRSTGPESRTAKGRLHVFSPLNPEAPLVLHWDGKFLPV